METGQVLLLGPINHRRDMYYELGHFTNISTNKTQAQWFPTWVAILFQRGTLRPTDDVWTKLLEFNYFAFFFR